MTKLALNIFPSHPDCVCCPLHAGVGPDGHVGVPSFLLSHPPSYTGGGSAVVFLGQNPGYHESKQNVPFVGVSGQRLKQAYIKGVSLGDLASIYLCNTARCYTAPTAPPKIKEYRTCASTHLLADLALILSAHTELAIVCLGAPAAATLTWLCTGQALSQQAAFGINGKVLSLPSKSLFTFFATYHPAACLRRKSLIDNVADHMELVRLWAQHRLPTASRPNFKRFQEVPTHVEQDRTPSPLILQPETGRLERRRVHSEVRQVGSDHLPEPTRDPPGPTAAGGGDHP